MSTEEIPVPRATLRDRARRVLSLSLLANHFPELHGVRVLAVFSVLQWHVTGVMATRGLLLTPEAQHFGMRSVTLFFGMDLFFVLSGFLIGSMLLHATANQEATGPARGWRGVLRFYARRAFRTFPLYYVVLTFLAFALPLTAAQQQSRWWEYLYLTNFRPILLESTVVMIWGWSLSVEEHFYLLVPLLLGGLHWLRGHTPRILLLLLLWGSALAIRLAIFHAQPAWTEIQHFQAFYVRTYTRFDPLVAGVLLAYTQHYFKAQVRAWLAQAWARWSLGAGAALCLLLLLFPHEIAGGTHFLHYRLYCWGTFTSLMYFAWLLLLLNTDGALKRLLGHRAFLHAATLGYGIYLVHIPVFQHWVIPRLEAMYRRGSGFGSVWLTGLAWMTLLSIVVAYLLHILVEKPMLALRDRWAA